MADRHLRRAAHTPRNAGFPRQVVPLPARQLQPRLQIEKRHRPVLELRPDDPFARKPEAVPIERERTLEVGDGDTLALESTAGLGEVLASLAARLR